MMRAPRFAAIAIVIAGLLAAPVTAAVAAPSADSQHALRESTRPIEPAPDELMTMIEVDPGDFVEAGADLPPELQQALARDVGLTGAEWLAQSEAGNAAADVVADLNEVIDIVDARLEGYDLVVTVESVTDARIAESVGARVEFGSASESREAATFEGLEPAADLRGGMPYFFDGARCSIGFVGKDTVTQQVQMMSAGHCENAVGALRRIGGINRPTISGGSTSASTSIGNGGLHVTDEFPNPGFDTGTPDFDPIPTFYDLGITPVTNATWAGKPEIVTWGNSTSGAPLASAPLVIRDAGPAIAGATVCKSGSTSGWTCGTIFADDPATAEDENGADVTVYVGDGSPECPAVAPNDYCVSSLVASICVRSGDSGGPAVVGSRAVGITSAATNAGASTCDLSDNIGIFGTLYSANPAWEQVTKVFPRWEPLIAVDEPTLTINDQTFTGELEFGGNRHSVAISFGTGERVTTQVQQDGTWSIDTSLTSPVTKTYSVTAWWGDGSRSSSIEGVLEGIETQRLFGTDRYQTAVEISKYAFGCGAVYPAANSCAPDEVPVVYIANGLNFPDALSAGPAATLEGGPLLLTSGTSISGALAAELTRLGPATIVVVGGEGVVSPAVASALAPFTESGSPDDVVRLGGASRYETSRLIAERLLNEGLISTGTELWVATGRNYPDALSAGAAAAGAGVPILLVDGNGGTLDADSGTFIGVTLGASAVSIAGGTGVVSSGIQSALGSLLGAGNVTRAGGADRFATSLLINQLAFPSSGPDAPEVYLTFGFNFPDALAGGVLAGTVGGPLYITQTACVTSGIVDHAVTASPSTIVVFGGTSVVSNNARDLRRC